MKLSALSTLLFPALLAVCPLVEAKNYVAAKALAGHLKPQGLTKSADADGLNKVRGQVTAILSAMQDSEMTGGPDARALLDTAYKMFRPEVGPMQRDASVAALTAMWSQARALGAFGENHKFTGTITRGPDAGQAVVFEHIVPVSAAPAFSRDLSNVRLVSPGSRRAEGAGPTARESAYITTLRSIEREVAGMKSLAKFEETPMKVPPKMDALGRTAAEAEAIWKEQMARDGELTKNLPRISVSGRQMATPSNRTGDKWVFRAEVTNLSQHATEVVLECFILGTTDKYRETYLMGEHRQTLRLRAGELLEAHFTTPLREGDYKGRADSYEQLSKDERRRSNASYRGAIFRVKHAKGIAATSASDPSLLDLMKDEKSPVIDKLPKLYADPKTWPKYTPPD